MNVNQMVWQTPFENDTEKITNGSMVIKFISRIMLVTPMEIYVFSLKYQEMFVLRVWFIVDSGNDSTPHKVNVLTFF